MSRLQPSTDPQARSGAGCRSEGTRFRCLSNHKREEEEEGVEPQGSHGMKRVVSDGAPRRIVDRIGEKMICIHHNGCDHDECGPSRFWTVERRRNGHGQGKV